MININKVDNRYTVSVNKHVVNCESFTDLIKVLKAIEIPEHELEYGLIQLESNDHNFAQFGTNRTFIYSKKV